MHTKNVGHLVFKVLGGHKEVEEFFSALDHRVNFTATTAEVGIIVESFPQVVDGLVARFGSSIEQNTNLWL